VSGLLSNSSAGLVSAVTGGLQAVPASGTDSCTCCSSLLMCNESSGNLVCNSCCDNMGNTFYITAKVTGTVPLYDSVSGPATTYVGSYDLSACARNTILLNQANAIGCTWIADTCPPFTESNGTQIYTNGQVYFLNNEVGGEYVSTTVKATWGHTNLELPEPTITIAFGDWCRPLTIGPITWTPSRSFTSP
jgi:hypothetical protein